MSSLKKAAAFTDIHWGRKNNSEQHTKDCINYISWFCENVKNDPTVDHIIFLGDYFENRTSINVDTFNQAYTALKQINSLGLPIYFLVGNHDLYYKHNRAVFSTNMFNELTNVNIINEPTKIDNMGNDGSMLAPFLFHHEYDKLSMFSDIPIWWGHFEFKDFVVTGNNIMMLEGPDHLQFKKQTRIFSGHFHKRQTNKNVTYIGNCFPMDFSDAGDNNRGMMIYDYSSNTPHFLNWEECPKYERTTISDIVDNKITLLKNSNVKCIADIELTYEEVISIKQAITEQYNLRDFIIEEIPVSITDINTDVSTDISSNGTIETIDELVLKMLQDINIENIDTKLLIEQYKRL